MSKADDVFIRQFGAIIAALVVFTVIVFVAARVIGGNAFAEMQNSPSAVATRLAPVGQVRVGDPAAIVAAAVPATTETADQGVPASPKDIYEKTCAACHVQGVAGAPKFGDEAAWAPRIELGMEAMVASVVNGKNAMPPRAGNPNLTDDEIKAAVEYLIGQGDAAEQPAQAEVAQAATPSATGATQTQIAEATRAAESDTSAGTAQAAESDTSTEATQAAAVAATTVAEAGKPGEEVYNSACFACHATGAANAPKLDDTAEWEKRAATGFDALLQSSINGKNAMPARGGNQSLTDDDLKNAIEFMLSKAGVKVEG